MLGRPSFNRTWLCGRGARRQRWERPVAEGSRPAARGHLFTVVAHCVAATAQAGSITCATGSDACRSSEPAPWLRAGLAHVAALQRDSGQARRLASQITSVRRLQETATWTIRLPAARGDAPVVRFDLRPAEATRDHLDPSPLLGPEAVPCDPRAATLVSPTPGARRGAGTGQGVRVIQRSSNLSARSAIRFATSVRSTTCASRL